MEMTKAEIAKAKKAERNRLAYQAKKEKIAEVYQANKEKIAEQNAEKKEEISLKNREAYQANKEKIAEVYQANKEKIAEKNADRREEIAIANKKRYDKESDELYRLLLLKNAGDEEAKDLYFDIKDKRTANFSNYYFEHAEEIYQRKQENKDKPKRAYDKTRMNKLLEEEKKRASKQYNSKQAKKIRLEYEKNAELEGIQQFKEEQEKREKEKNIIVLSVAEPIRDNIQMFIIEKE
jgi:hypothetical protein